nr:uncharacterized protein LOC129413569 isoform X2 [Misgurnus anguillicaudatus]
MKHLFNSLLLISWLTLPKILETGIKTGNAYEIDRFFGGYDDDDDDFLQDPRRMNPQITVYQQVEDRRSVIVICRPNRRIKWESCTLTVEDALDYTKEEIQSSRADMCVFKVTVSPPASFTCMLRTQRIETYYYDGSGNLDSDYNENGSVIGGFLSIGICLIIITAGVVVSNIRYHS